MSENFPPWLTKQMVRGVRGFNLDAYLVALEGWRRGLSLKWYLDPSKVTDLKIIGFYPLGKTFSLSSKDKKHFFYRSRGDKVANKAVEIGTNKEVTKERLSKAGVPIPKGKGFNSETSVEEIVNYGLSLGFPLVVKPTFGSLGKGVSTNIQNELDLKTAIQHVWDIGYDHIVIERFVTGDDYRIYVVGDQVIGATKRLPSNVLGDGQHKIAELIDLKNETRKENPYLRTRLIKTDSDLTSYLQEQNYSLESVPSENKKVYLRGAANISGGGDPIDALNNISDEIKTIAVNAVKAIPGLHHAGIDIIVHDNDGVVLEINPTADISMHIFPIKGNPRNIPESIIDFYFPNTKGMAMDNAKTFFGYREINRLLRSGLVQGYKVTEATPAPLYAKRYIVSGKVQKVSYRRWIQREALKRDLHGYTRNLRNGKVVVVVGGEKDQVDNFKKICKKGSLRTKVRDVKEYLWDHPIKTGFEIRSNRVRK